MGRLLKKGEFTSLIALSVLLFIGVISFAASLSNKDKTTYKSQARERLDSNDKVKEIPQPTNITVALLSPVPSPTGSGKASGFINTPVPTKSTGLADRISDALSGLRGGASQCTQASGGGNDCTKYLESVTATGITDGGIIDSTTFSCDISTKNICGLRTDKDNICGVKINDGWPVWCPWNGVGQDLNASSIVSRGTCNLSNVKPGDKLQVVAARAYGSCAEIPWNTAGSFIAGQTFYYKQKPTPQGNQNGGGGGGGEDQNWDGGNWDNGGSDWGGENLDGSGGGDQNWGGEDWNGGNEDYSGGGNGGQDYNSDNNTDQSQPSTEILELSDIECTPLISYRDASKNASSWKYDKANNLLCYWFEGQETDCCTSPPTWYKK